jgi:UPF0716 family protein affecting phage T7 exclusion
MAYDSSTSEAEASASGHGRSAGDLLRQLVSDVSVLFRKELALVASEVTQSVDEAKHGAQSMITGGAVLYAGVLFLLGAVALFIANFLALWLSTLIVGAVVTVIGAIMVSAGKKRMSAQTLTPERTISSLRKDKDAVQRQVS